MHPPVFSISAKKKFEWKTIIQLVSPLVRLLLISVDCDIRKMGKRELPKYCYKVISSNILDELKSRLLHSSKRAISPHNNTSIPLYKLVYEPFSMVW
jgi:hypothetical protein